MVAADKEVERDIKKFKAEPPGHEVEEGPEEVPEAHLVELPIPPCDAAGDVFVSFAVTVPRGRSFIRIQCPLLAVLCPSSDNPGFLACSFQPCNTW